MIKFEKCRLNVFMHLNFILLVLNTITKNRFCHVEIIANFCSDKSLFFPNFFHKKMDWMHLLLLQRHRTSFNAIELRWKVIWAWTLWAWHFVNSLIRHIISFSWSLLPLKPCATQFAFAKMADQVCRNERKIIRHSNDQIPLSYKVDSNYNCIQSSFVL